MQKLEGQIWNVLVNLHFDSLQILSPKFWEQHKDCVSLVICRFHELLLFKIHFTAWKVSKYGVFSDPYFPAFGLNTESYGVSLGIQSECGKIRIRKNSVFGPFSHSTYVGNYKAYFSLENIPHYFWCYNNLNFKHFKDKFLWISVTECWRVLHDLGT